MQKQSLNGLETGGIVVSLSRNDGLIHHLLLQHKTKRHMTRFSSLQPRQLPRNEQKPFYVSYWGIPIRIPSNFKHKDKKRAALTSISAVLSEPVRSYEPDV